MTSWIRLTLPLAVTLPLACTPTPEEVASTSDAASSSSTSAGPGPSTTPGTTMPGDDTVGTQGLTGTDTTMGAVDTTVGVSATEGTTSVDPSTSGSSSSSSSGGESSSSSGESSSTGDPPPECLVPTDCPNNETCNAMGDCESVCAGPGWGPDDYSYCLTPLGGFDSATICGESQSCVNSGGMNGIEVVVCGKSCTTVCDCPTPPPTGNATVTCADLSTADGDECYLSCADGETCPDGMECRNGGGGISYCTHPVQDLPMYGNCGNVDAPCINGTCATGSDGMGNDWAVCVTLCDGGIGECDAAPAGVGAVASCEGVISPPMGPDCHLDCGMDTDCPNGMDCLSTGMDNLCMWPT